MTNLISNAVIGVWIVCIISFSFLTFLVDDDSLHGFPFLSYHFFGSIPLGGVVSKVLSFASFQFVVNIVPLDSI